MTTEAQQEIANEIRELVDALNHEIRRAQSDGLRVDADIDWIRKIESRHEMPIIYVQVSEVL